MKTKTATKTKTKPTPLRKHEEKFKRDAVLMLEARGNRTVQSVADECKVAVSQLYDWKQQYGSQIAGTGAETIEDEVRRLRREVAQVTRERDFLKKATAFFAKDIK